MTYIDYLNNFNRWLETNALPASSQLMYFKLLDVFNRTGWAEKVGVDNLRLQLMIEAGTGKTAIRARDALVKAGLVTYTKGKKGTPNSYSLCDITVIQYGNPVINTVGNTVINDGKNDSVNDSESENPVVCTVENTVTNPVINTVGNTVINDSHIKTKNKTKTKKSITPYIPPYDDYGFSDAVKKILDEWFTYKAVALKFKYEEISAKKLLSQVSNAIDKFGEQAVISQIDTAIAGCWKGMNLHRMQPEPSKFQGSRQQQSSGNIFAKLALEEMEGGGFDIT